MANEPQSSMDQQLRAFAQQRRAQVGNPASMPAAMRAKLHGEIERQYAPEGNAPGGLWRGLVALWPRLAFGGALLVFIGFATLHWFPSSAPQSGSAAKVGSVPVSPKAETQSLALADVEGAASAPAANAPPVAASRELFSAPAAAMVRPGANEIAQVAAQPSAPLADAPVARETSERTEFGELSVRANTTTAADKRDEQIPTLALRAAPVSRKMAVAEPEALAGTSAPAAARFATISERATHWNFTNSQPDAVLRRNFNSPPRPNILQRFEMQISGTQLRVVDEDGSVYEGTLSANAQATSGSESMLRSKSGTVSTAPAGLSFRGVHRTSGRPVRFDGTLESEPAPTATNATLRGTALVGDRTQLQIRAAGTQP